MKCLVLTIFSLLTLATPVYSQPLSYADYVNTGSSLIDAGEYQKAIQYLNEAVKMNADGEYSNVAYFYLGYAYQKLNLDQTAIINFNHSIQINSLDSVDYCARGLSYFKLKEYEKSKSDYVKCSDIALQNGNMGGYQAAQDSIATVQNAINLTKPKPQPVVTTPQTPKKITPVVDAKTRNKIVSRACSLAKKGLTDGEILNEVYQLVRINANPEYQTVYSSSYGSSAASQISSMVNQFTNSLNSSSIKEEALNIFASAKKKCKF